MVTFDKSSGKGPDKGTVGLIGWGALSHGLAFWLAHVPEIAVAATHREGLVNGSKATFRCREISTSSLTVTLKSTAPAQWDTAWLCVRAPDLLSAAREWLPRLRPGIPVTILCNGRIEDEVRTLRAEFPHFRWRQGVAFFGTKEEGDGWLVSGGGKVLLGALDRNDSSTTFEDHVWQALASAGFLWVKNPREVVREKWWLNTVLNTLCARWRLAENRLALQYPDELRQLGEEAYALGEELDGAWPQELSLYQKALQELIQATAANENSLARALRLKLPHENEYLGGVVEKARGAYPLLRAYVKAIS